VARGRSTTEVVREGHGLASRSRSLAAVFRFAAGLAFVGPDRVAGLGGLLHEWLQFWMRDWPVLGGHGIEGPPPSASRMARYGAADPLFTRRAGA
jgi:hypothetical protein